MAIELTLHGYMKSRQATLNQWIAIYNINAMS